jgi:hypothetical protein
MEMNINELQQTREQMKSYKMILECHCELVWYEGELFPGVGGYAECALHGTQKIIEAWEAE